MLEGTLVFESDCGKLINDDYFVWLGFMWIMLEFQHYRCLRRCSLPCHWGACQPQRTAACGLWSRGLVFFFFSALYCLWRVLSFGSFRLGWGFCPVWLINLRLRNFYLCRSQIWSNLWIMLFIRMPNLICYACLTFTYGKVQLVYQCMAFITTACCCSVGGWLLDLFL